MFCWFVGCLAELRGLEEKNLISMISRDCKNSFSGSLWEIQHCKYLKNASVLAAASAFLGVLLG